MKKNDWILAGSILFVCLALLAFRFFREERGGRVVVASGGDLYGAYSLSEDRTVSIGGTNRIIIENGTVKMEWADCPDQICVRHRKISRNGESIICLPNEVVVTIENGETSEVDGVAQ